MADIAQNNLFLDGFYTVESPEQVEIEFELAGPGSRFCALVIDVLVMIAIFMLAAILLIVLASAQRMMPQMSDQQIAEWIESWLLAAMVVVFFLLNFGYFLFSEWFTRGRSLGKMVMQLRVVRDDGTPMTGVDILLRNLLRAVDALPAGYVVGGAVSFFHPLHKRLGDLAAGTIVVKERHLDYASRPDTGRRLAFQPIAIGNMQLSADERRLLQGYLRRRDELPHEVRRRAAQHMAERLAQHHGGDTREPDRYLESLAQGGSRGA